MGQPENMSSAPQVQTIQVCERQSRLEIAVASAAERQIASRRRKSRRTAALVAVL